MKKRFWLSLLIVMLARIPFLHISFFSVDEAVSAVAANEILHGQLPYRDAIDHRGPLTYYFYAAVFSVAGQSNMWAIHISYLILHLILCFLVYKLAFIWWKNEEHASWSALIYALFSSCLYFTEGLAAHTEWLLSISVVSAWLVFCKWKSPFKYLLAGLLLGMAISSKQVAALDAVALTLGIWLQKGKFTQKLGFTIQLGIGTFVLPGVFVLLFWKGNALEDLIFYALTYNTQYYIPELSVPERLLNNAKLLGSFALQNWIVFPLGILGFISLLQFKAKQFDSRKLLLLIWMIFSLMEALAGGRAFGHYLIPFLTPLSIWGGALLAERNKYFQRESILVKTFMPLIALLMAGQLAYLFQRHKHMLGNDPSISEYLEVSQYLQSRLEKDERIFVWGFSPEIYLLSDSRPASRFSFCNPLSGHLPASNEAKPDTRYAIVPGSWDSLAADFKSHPPLYIIDTQPAGFKAYGKFPIRNYPFMKNYLDQFEVDSVFIRLNPADSIKIHKRIIH
ncbi:MAG: glycosyltransferase family 39 protein [Bacteroidia bacterium]|nr:glycosyltransferase family 39 protein [Bacteroidia bacterium]